MYLLKDKLNRFLKVIKWIPIIWKSNDYDYEIAVYFFKEQLKDISKFLKSEKAVTESSSIKAMRIDTICRLIDKVYREDYLDYEDKLIEKYGVGVFELELGGSPYYFGFDQPNDWNSPINIKKDREKFYKESIEKQNKAHRILWKLIEHNIRDFAD